MARDSQQERLIAGRMSRVRLFRTRIAQNNRRAREAADQAMADAGTREQVLDALSKQLSSASRKEPIGALLGAAGSRLSQLS